LGAVWPESHLVTTNVPLYRTGAFRGQQGHSRKILKLRSSVRFAPESTNLNIKMDVKATYVFSQLTGGSL
ncbi:hypothetical protein Bca52824_096934, partial [Brassica carinata]